MVLVIGGAAALVANPTGGFAYTGVVAIVYGNVVNELFIHGAAAAMAAGPSAGPNAAPHPHALAPPHPMGAAIKGELRYGKEAAAAPHAAPLGRTAGNAHGVNCPPYMV